MPLPDPKLWENGESVDSIPTAEDLNRDWRDSFQFLLGVTKPMIYLQSSSSQALASNVQTTVNWQVETLKRGGMVHSTSSNTHLITVPYTGQYTGYMFAGLGAFTTTATKLKLRLIDSSGPVLAISETKAESTAGGEVYGTFTVDLVANASVFMTVTSTASTSSTSTAPQNRPKFAMWYSGDYN